MEVQILLVAPLLFSVGGARTNGGRLTVNQVTRIGRWFDSARSHQFLGEVLSSRQCDCDAVKTNPISSN